jgi:hemerythrin-like domain-containing protein
MSSPLDRWHQEHAHFRRLLEMLQQELDVFHGAERPDYQLMLDVIRQLRDLGDGQHHPREDAAFERLVARQPDMLLPLNRLRQEHRVIAQAGEILARQLDGVLNGLYLPRAELEMAAATYLVYYTSHISREEENILPLPAAALTPADWQAVMAAA